MNAPAEANEPTLEPQGPERSRTTFWLMLGVVALLSFMMRTSSSIAIEYPESPLYPDGFLVNDPDSQYHFRRVERLFVEGFPAAERDPFLDYPNGSRIPWPPYYTYALWLICAPGAPDFAPLPEEGEPTTSGLLAGNQTPPGVLWNARDGRGALRTHIEQRSASITVLFGIATSLMAALAGWYLMGAGGGLFAGGYHALTAASANYSNLGNGDHHAWVSMLLCTTLMLLTGALVRGALQSPKRALRWGIAAGLVAGVMMGSWVASLLYVLQTQFFLGWLILVHTRKPMPGLPAFGLAYHLSAAAILLPAVLASAWTEDYPWMVVNLSWFHPAQLLVGAAVFVPLLKLKSGKAFRFYPLLVVAGLGFITLLLYVIDAGPYRGIREGFDWVSKGNEFMATVNESRPMNSKQDPPGFERFWFGIGIYLFIPAWLWAAWRTFFKGQSALLPWVLAAPILGMQAWEQRRFGEAFAVPMALIVGWALAATYYGSRPTWLAKVFAPVRRWPAWGQGVLALVVLMALQIVYLNQSIGRWRSEREATNNVRVVGSWGWRTTMWWIRNNTPEPPDYSVLGAWDDGHAIEWVAGRPTVATNFGNYVGDGYYVPAKFFMEENMAAAEQMLIDRKVRYVLVHRDHERRTEAYIRSACPENFARYGRRLENGGLALQPAWMNTVGHKLTRDGYSQDKDGRSLSSPMRYLRLVFMSPFRILPQGRIGVSASQTTGWVWEYVKGATVEVQGKPGDRLNVRFQIRFENAEHTLSYSDSAIAGNDGVARLRVPYSTVAPNGDGKPASAAWDMAGRGGRLVIPEKAVLEGRTIQLK